MKTELCSRFPAKSTASPDTKAQAAARSCQLLSGHHAGDIRPWHWRECVIMTSDVQHKVTFRPVYNLQTWQISAGDPYGKEDASLHGISLGVDVNLFLTVLWYFCLPTAFIPWCLKSNLTYWISDISCCAISVTRYLMGNQLGICLCISLVAVLTFFFFSPSWGLYVTVPEKFYVSFHIEKPH